MTHQGESAMSRTLKLAMIPVLMLATSSAALAAEFDWNPANRYPTYDSPTGRLAPYLGTMPQDASQPEPRGTFQSAPVRLHQRRIAPQASGQFNGLAGQQDEIGVDLADHASSPYADR
jgi:hypothetical protein